MPPSRRRPGNRNQSRPPHRVSDARSAALAALNRLGRFDTTLDHVLDQMAGPLSGLSRRDRALFNQLVYGVLRWRLRLDAVIEAHADRPLKKLTPVVLDILRLGMLQIQYMDRIPPSAVVNTSVDLARSHHAGPAAGFVNALLRNALRRPDRFVLPDPQRSPVDHVSVDKSFPRWLVKRWIDRYGLEATRQLCDAVNAIPPLTLRCNTLKNNPPELIAALSGQADEIRPAPHPAGALDLIGPHRPIHEMPAFKAGRFAVQDAAAQLVSLLLAPQPEETVLDACAGLGGKTAHLAALMQNRGQVVAVDTVAAKLTRLESEARRQGIRIILTRQADLNQCLPDGCQAAYDRVLLDAPCTGLGVLRRNPDAKWSTREKDIARCADRQLRFLERLAPLVKPGGVLVFSVCSTEPEENEAVINRFLINQPNFAIDNHRTTDEKSVQPFLGPDGFLRTLPHNHRMDGFFAARLHRRC